MVHSSSRTCRIGLALTGVAALLQGVPLAGARPTPGPQERSVTADLVDTTLFALREGRLSAPDAVSALSVGSGAADALFGGLSRGTLRMHQPDRSVTSTRLSAYERALLIDALGRLPWSDVVARLEVRRSATVELSTQLAAMEVLGALGRPEDVRALLAWAEVGGKSVRVAPEVRAQFTTRLDELLERRPEALGALPRSMATLNRSLLAPALRGLVQTPSAPRLATLGELLRTVPELEAHVLVEIGHMASRSRAVPEAATRERVRRYLGSHNPVLVHEAIAAAGHLCDREAIPDLIRLLDSSDKAAVQRAHQALIKITGQQLAMAPRAWQDWHAATSDWWHDEAQERIGVAVSGPPGAASLALQELAKLRLYRDELAPALARGLQREELELLLLTCATLGHLGSPAAVKPLLDTLVHPNVDVRRAAYLALRRISGENHGDNPAAWRAQGW